VGLSASGSASAVPKCLMTQKCAVSGLASAAVLPVASSAMQVGSEEQHEVYSDAEEDLGSSDWEDDGAGSACMEEIFYDAPESPPVSAKTARRHARRAIAAAAAALPVRHYRLQSVTTFFRSLCSFLFAAVMLTALPLSLQSQLHVPVCVSAGRLSSMGTAIAAMAGTQRRPVMQSFSPLPDVAGYRCISMPVDTGCTNCTFKSASSLTSAGPSNMTVTSANGGVEQVQSEGVSSMILPGPGGALLSVQLARCIVVPQLSQLLAVNALRAAGVGVSFPANKPPYIKFLYHGSKVRIPLRYGTDRLWYLDFLQPTSPGLALSAPVQQSEAVSPGVPVESHVQLQTGELAPEITAVAVDTDGQVVSASVPTTATMTELRSASGAC
jgi:hypothetical protein